MSQTHGRIVEEDHYYAYGLKIACISSRKLGDAAEGSLKNNNLYNDKELNDDADLNWYNNGFRSYDPQIGRFPQLDPLTDEYPELTNYQYASNDPIANIDIDGLEGGLSTTAATAKILEEATVTSTRVAQRASSTIIRDIAKSSMAGIDLLMPEPTVTPLPPGVHSETSTIQQHLNNAIIDRSAGSEYSLSPFCLSCETGEQRAINRQKILNWREANGYNPDGSTPWLTKLSENKHFERFASHIVFPTIEMAGGYGMVKGIATLAAEGGSNYLYHYTSKEAAEAISQQGLKVGRDGFSYLTNKGGLSPLQAQIELALPANRALPNSILRIDASGLNPALIRRVSGNLPGYGAGGGTEFLFNQHIPANLIKVIK